MRVTEHESQTSPDSVEVTLLFRNQQILREGPLVVDPLGIAAKSRARCHLRDFFSLVFVGAFRPDRFVFAQHDPQIGGANVDPLPPRGTQIHSRSPFLDPPPRLAPSSP